MVGVRAVAGHLARLWSGCHHVRENTPCAEVGHDWCRRLTVVRAGCPAVEEWRCARCGAMSVDTQSPGAT